MYQILHKMAFLRKREKCIHSKSISQNFALHRCVHTRHVEAVKFLCFRSQFLLKFCASEFAIASSPLELFASASSFG